MRKRLDYDCCALAGRLVPLCTVPRVALHALPWASMFWPFSPEDAERAISLHVYELVLNQERIAIYPPVGRRGIDRLLNFVAVRGATGLSMQILSDQRCLSNCFIVAGGYGYTSSDDETSS